MGFSGAFDPLVEFALLSSAVAFGIASILFVCVMVLRIRLLKAREQQRGLIERWRPLLSGIALDGWDEQFETRLKGLKPRNRFETLLLLHEWNVLRDVLEGSAGTNLIRAGYNLGLGTIARAMVRGARSLDDQLLGVVTLGHLGDVRSWNDIVPKLDARNSVLSLMAAKALVNIDAERAMPFLIPRITMRTDWSAARVSGILLEAGPDATSVPLCDAILAAEPEDAEKLIAFLPVVHNLNAGTVVREMLGRAVDDRIIGACLKVTENPIELPEVRRFATHPRWHIRMRAASALGRIGGNDDKQLLIAMLADREWWVRYRAAEALADLPFIGTRELEVIGSELSDRYGREMLNQVMAERAAV